jgi:hypothetical protein
VVERACRTSSTRCTREHARSRPGVHLDNTTSCYPGCQSPGATRLLAAGGR